MSSRSTTGDSIEWRAARIDTGATGTYEIVAGAGIGQTGSWRLALLRGTAVAAPGKNPAATISVFRTDWPSWLALVAVVSGFLWGFWKIWARPVARRIEWTEPVSAADAKLRGVGGWMLLFLFGRVVTVLLSVPRFFHGIKVLYSGSWSLGSLIPGLQPQLVAESLARGGQVVLCAIAVFLTTRLDPRARPWWLLVLALLFTYCAADIALSGNLTAQMTIIDGAAVGARVAKTHDSARTVNFSTMLASAIWFLYWYRSRRVLLNFGSTRELPPR
jgi:hypothetical protein